MFTICSIVVACGLVAIDDRPTRPMSHDRTPSSSSRSALIGLANSVNLEAFATSVVRGRANLAIIGDSINSFGQPNWMYTGYLLDWRPHRWHQIHTSPASNSAATGTWVEYAGAADYPMLRPGQSKVGSEAFAGQHTWTLRVLEADQWTGRAISSGVNKGSFDYEGGMFIDADGQGRFLRSGHLQRHRSMILAAEDPAFRTEWTVKSRNSASGIAWTSTELDHHFDCSPNLGLAWFDHVIEGSADGLGHVGTGLYTSSEGPIFSGVRTGLPGTIITDLELEDGLGLSFIGHGGWRTENHLLPYGDPDVPLLSSSDGPYPASYSDQALKEHILAHEITHFLLWIGTNNGGTDSAEPWTTAEDVAGIMERCRRVHADARKIDPSLLEPEFLIVAPYSSNDTDVFSDGYALALRNLAGDDVAFIDLRQIVMDRFGPWSAWEQTLLSDGTHPSLTGCRTFAQLLWRELIAAAGSTADLNRDGVVNGADFGLLLGQWGCVDPGYADLTGDGCVTGQDLGILLGQWTVDSGG